MEGSLGLSDQVDVAHQAGVTGPLDDETMALVTVVMALERLSDIGAKLRIIEYAATRADVIHTMLKDAEAKARR